MVQNLPCLRAAPRILELFFWSSEKLTAEISPGIRSLCSLPKKRRPLKRPLQCLGYRKVKLHETQRLMKKGPSCTQNLLQKKKPIMSSLKVLSTAAKAKQLKEKKEKKQICPLIAGSFF